MENETSSKQKYKGLIIGLILSAMTTFFVTLAFIFSFPLPDIFVGFVSLSVLATCLLATYFLHRQSSWTYAAVLFLICWCAALFYWVPQFAEKELTRIAKDQVPSYPGIELADVSYRQAHGVQGASVVISYYSEDPEKDFPEVKRYFSEQLAAPVWKLNNLRANEQKSLLPETLLDSIIFDPMISLAGDHFFGVFEGKGIELLPSITLRYQAGDDNPIQAVASF